MMCLLAFQLQSHPKYQLVMMANRDEAYGRPTAPANFWSDYPDILAGRDLEQMGTWLGINTQGKVAALTNYRDFALPQTGKFSRGHIVSSYLQSNLSAHDFMEQLHTHREDYAGCNVLVGSAEEMFYYSNIEQSIQQLPNGTHGLSNALLNTPWPKVDKTKALLAEYLQQVETIDRDILFGMMQRAERFPTELLPDTGVGEDLESLLSSIFIASKDYGTRCTTVLTIDQENHVEFEERTYEKGAFITAQKFSFHIEKPAHS
ncbi:NRDE family protein [Sporosarcina ureae]|uniref:NRDE family protein n=1 Tax=Sporosarcina ureae TaxID=1571 RepID=UPI001E3E4088|nr:NRDE family protein [Sporosarcina ureae]